MVQILRIGALSAFVFALLAKAQNTSNDALSADGDHWSYPHHESSVVTVTKTEIETCYETETETTTKTKTKTKTV